MKLDLPAAMELGVTADQARRQLQMITREPDQLWKCFGSLGYEIAGTLYGALIDDRCAPEPCAYPTPGHCTDGT